MATSVLVVIILSFPVLSSRNDHLRFNVFFWKILLLVLMADFLFNQMQIQSRRRLSLQNGNRH